MLARTLDVDYSTTRFIGKVPKVSHDGQAGKRVHPGGLCCPAVTCQWQVSVGRFRCEHCRLLPITWHHDRACLLLSVAVEENNRDPQLHNAHCLIASRRQLSTLKPFCDSSCVCNFSFTVRVLMLRKMTSSQRLNAGHTNPLFVSSAIGPF
jgi:hypothetical protein